MLLPFKEPSEGSLELTGDPHRDVTNFGKVAFADVFHKASILEEQVLE